MSQSRDLQLHINQLEEIRSILNAMKNLAFMVLYKISRLQHFQSQVVAHIEDSAATLLTTYPDTLIIERATQPVYIVIGSERGFCGDFNEQLLDSLANQACEGIIVIGSRLLGHLDSYPYPIIASLVGANVEEDVPSLLEQLFEQFEHLPAEQTLIAVFHDHPTDVIKQRQILPLHVSKLKTATPVLLNLPPELFFSNLLKRYLLAVLHEIIYLSLLSENHRRLQHLDGAVQHLDNQTKKLQRKSQVYRQEEITEEIEVILLGS
jgi:F-type H+-transporting ATPase subunit gamma